MLHRLTQSLTLCNSSTRNSSIDLSSARYTVTRIVGSSSLSNSSLGPIFDLSGRAMEELNTDRRSSCLWLPRKLSNHMDRQDRTGDTMLVNRYEHRVYRVLGFFFSRPNWDPPPPPAIECVLRSTKFYKCMNSTVCTVLTCMYLMCLLTCTVSTYLNVQFTC
jgi:hypothetical protein